MIVRIRVISFVYCVNEKYLYIMYLSTLKYYSFM